jgi:hypothetical protein
MGCGNGILGRGFDGLGGLGGCGGFEGCGGFGGCGRKEDCDDKCGRRFRHKRCERECGCE